MTSEDVLTQAERDAETAEELFWVGGARRIRALAAEVRELRKDKARLDWLLSMRGPTSMMLFGEAEVALAGGRDGIDAAMGGEAQTHD